MNQQVLDIMDKIENATKKLTVCQQKKCKLEYEAGNKQREETKKKIALLVEQMKKKEISLAGYVKELQHMTQSLTKSKVTKDLMKCSAKQCQQEMRAQLQSMMKAAEHDCLVDKDQKRCDIFHKMEKILKKPDLSTEDYQQLLLLFKTI